MLKAILLDLDGTLLGCSMETFVPAYLQALGAYLTPHVRPDRLVSELLKATKVMAANDGRGPTNEELFASVFYPALGMERDVLETHIRRFYAEEFPKLQKKTHAVPEARPLVEWAFERGLQVVIATNPLFPRTAIEQRMEWAGVAADHFPYALVTTYEVMHASKESAAYYEEILRLIGREPSECLMVGDDWVWDVVPAAGLGLKAWWVTDGHTEPPSPAPSLLGSGTLAEFWAFVQSGRLDFR